MSKYTDLSGRSFGDLTVMARAQNSPEGSARWSCRCVCGLDKDIKSSNLLSGNYTNCGGHGRKNEIDMSCLRFGKLTIGCRIGRSRQGKVLWSAYCDCGMTISTTAYLVRSGQKVDCGCSYRNAQDFAGKTFGRLTVISHDGYTKNGDARWVCLCRCGTVKSVIINALKYGDTVSCGCHAKEKARLRLKGYPAHNISDLTGQRFGRLVAIKQAGKKGRQWTWECRCDCGETRIILASSLRAGNSASCGCARELRITVRPEYARAKCRNNSKRRYRQDPAFRLRVLMGKSIREKLKRGGGHTKSRTFDMLGYSAYDLEKSLRNTIPVGHTWDDFMSGRLEIDHVIPVSVFNITAEHDIDFRRAWAISNLQLLTAQDNRDKRAKLLKPFQPSLALAIEGGLGIKPKLRTHRLGAATPPRLGANQ